MAPLGSRRAGPAAHAYPGLVHPSQRQRGGVQSVELLLDPESETRVLRLWTLLFNAGLPSQARHRGASNRPHATLVAVPTLPDGVDGGLVDALAGRLPAVGTWGEVTAFGHGPWTVVWLVEPSAGMRRLQQEVARVCAIPEGHLTSPARWTPHVTLARRVSEPDLNAVRTLVSGPVEAATGMPVLAPTVRRWDGAAKVDWVVASAPARPARPARPAQPAQP